MKIAPREMIHYIILAVAVVSIFPIFMGWVSPIVSSMKEVAYVVYVLFTAGLLLVVDKILHKALRI